MNSFRDLTNSKFGKLLVLGLHPDRTPSGGFRWVCRCDCGIETVIGGTNIQRQISCGCAGSRKTMGERSKKHGHSIGYRKSRTAAAWRNAKTRCFNKANAKYPAYGGRGITMCDEWSDDFSVFLRDMGACPEGLTLERIDVNGNYEPGNCRWATKQEQHANKRSTVRVGTMTLRDFAASVGVNYKRIHYRMTRHGETPQQAAKWFIRCRRTVQNSTQPHRN